MSSCRRCTWDGVGLPHLSGGDPHPRLPNAGPTGHACHRIFSTSQKAQRSETPPETDSGTEGGCEFGSAGSPAPASYFCAHLSSPPHNLKVAPSISPYRHGNGGAERKGFLLSHKAHTQRSHLNWGLCPEATPGLATPQPAPGPLLRFKFSKHRCPSMSSFPCQAFLIMFLWSVGGGWSPEAPFKAHFHVLHRSSWSSVQGVKAWGGGTGGMFPLPFQPPGTFGSRAAFRLLGTHRRPLHGSHTNTNSTY